MRPPLSNYRQARARSQLVGVTVCASLVALAALCYFFWDPDSGARYVEPALADSSTPAATVAPVRGGTERLDRFFEFQGIEFGDREADLVRKLGAPARTDSLSGRTWHEYPDDLHVSCDAEGRVNSLYMRVVEPVTKPGELPPIAEGPATAPESKEPLLGMTRTEILRRFGYPASVAPFMIFYSYSDGARKVGVAFEYSRSDFRCCNVSVVWTYPASGAVTAR